MAASFKNMYPVPVFPALGLTNLLEGIRNSTQIVNEAFGTNGAGDSSPNHNTFIHIIQIGAGGTGGYVAAEIMRFLGNIPPALKRMIVYTLCDGDSFEPKNLGRQLCTEEDLGVNKAEALISNYGPYFGCNMENLRFIPTYLKSIHDLADISYGVIQKRLRVVEQWDSDNESDDKITATSLSEVYAFKTPYIGGNGGRHSLRDKVTIIPIFIDCVDKNAPRKIIHDYLEGLNRSQATPFITSIIRRVMRDNVISTETMHNGERVCIDNNGDIICVNNNGRVSKLDTILALEIEKTISPHTYIISSGNGQFTGQVFWGRYTSGNITHNPIKYSDVYGDETVSPIFDRTDISTVLEDDQKCDQPLCVLVGTPDAKNHRFKPDVSSVEELLNLERKIKNKYLRELFKASNSKVFADATVLRDYTRKFKLYRPVSVDSANNTYDNDINYHDTFERFISAHMSVPSPYVVFPELIDVSVDAREEQMSCAERAAVNVQNINANKTAANLVMNYFTSIINGLLPLEPGSTVPISTAGVKFDTRTNNFMPEVITTDYLKRYE